MIFRHKIKRILISDHPASIVRVFENSRLYGGKYVEPPANPWKWPVATWLARRRAELGKK